jgi:hypothetical protein
MRRAPNVCGGTRRSLERCATRSKWRRPALRPYGEIEATPSASGTRACRLQGERLRRATREVVLWCGRCAARFQFASPLASENEAAGAPGGVWSSKIRRDHAGWSAARAGRLRPQRREVMARRFRHFETNRRRGRAEPRSSQAAGHRAHATGPAAGRFLVCGRRASRRVPCQLSRAER